MKNSNQPQLWRGFATWVKHNRRDYTVTASNHAEAHKKISDEAKKFAPQPIVQDVRPVRVEEITVKGGVPAKISPATESRIAAGLKKFCRTPASVVFVENVEKE